MALSLYLDHPSWLHRRHPVAKVLALGWLFVAAFLLDHPAPLGLLLVLVLAATASARALSVLHQMRWLLLPVFVFTTIIWTVFYPATADGPVDRWVAFRYGLGMALRLETFLATGFVFLATTTIEEFAFALSRLGVPYRAGFVLTLAFRLVPVFLDAALTVRDAQRCRGLDFTTGNVATRIARYAPVIVPVFIGGLRRADQMAFALEVRGFSAGRPRTSLPRPGMDGSDLLLLGVGGAITAVVVALRVAGIGRLVAQ
ncbi:MAG: energy-coupling factor transporter transmembrane protein EcfT [Deltaproteobacteria bacterium]|nr:energy-coupling factor transporter transmembrane protein EcfT [Deltaproteobacteria bacterium]